MKRLLFGFCLIMLLCLARPMSAFAQGCLVDTCTPTPTSTDTPSPTATDTPTATPTLTSTPDIYFYTTLSSGQAARIAYEISAGDAGSLVMSFIEVGLLVFVVFLLLMGRRK